MSTMFGSGLYFEVAIVLGDLLGCVPMVVLNLRPWRRTA